VVIVVKQETGSWIHMLVWNVCYLPSFPVGCVTACHQVLLLTVQPMSHVPAGVAMG